MLATVLTFFGSKTSLKLYEENYKTLIKEIKDLNKWRDTPCSWIGTLNIVQMPVLPRLIYRFNAVPIKIPPSYLVDTDKLILTQKARCLCTVPNWISKTRVLGEVEEDSFIALPVKGRYSRLMPLKNCVTQPLRIWWGVL